MERRIGLRQGAGQKRVRRDREAQGNSGDVPGTSNKANNRFATPCSKWIFHVSPHGAGSVTRADVNNIFSSYFSHNLMTYGKRFPARWAPQKILTIFKKFISTTHSVVVVVVRTYVRPVRNVISSSPYESPNSMMLSAPHTVILPS